MMLKLSPSSEKFQQLDFLLTMRARLMNPKVYFDLKDIPIEFLLNDIDDLDDAIEMFFLMNSTNE